MAFRNQSSVDEKNTDGLFKESNNPMDIKVNGSPFSALLNQAVKMKTAQTNQYREKYNSFPRYYQNSMFLPKKEVEIARSCSSYSNRMCYAKNMKIDGNTAFQALDYDEALLNYEMAASVFKFIENTNPSFRTDVSLLILSLSSYVPIILFILVFYFIFYFSHTGDQGRRPEGSHLHKKPTTRRQRNTGVSFFLLQ